MQTTMVVSVAASLAAVVISTSVVIAAPPSATGRASSGGGSARRLSCDEVIERVSHGKRVAQGKPLSLKEMARELGTSTDWLQQCLTAYGRRLPRGSQVESHESAREDRLEGSEEEEAEEVAPEDIPEPGEGEQYGEPPEKQLRPTRPTPQPRDLVF